MMCPVVRHPVVGKLLCELLKCSNPGQHQYARLFGDNAMKILNNAVCKADLPKRPLGGLEKYYYHWTNIWDDAFGCYISFTSKYPINIELLASALSATVQQHPVLQIKFKKTFDTVELVPQMGKVDNIEIVEQEDFQRIFQSFSLENKMWRLVLLNPQSKETKNLSLIFSVHHSLCDFTYKRAIIRHLLKSLATLQQEGSITESKIAAFSCPIEDFIQNTTNTGTDKHINFPTTDWKHKEKITAIDICKRHFGIIYTETCRESTSKVVRWSVNRNMSQAFRLSTAKCQGSVNSALLAVFLMSFLELLENSMNHTDVVEVPFSVMVNLRRYIGNDHVYNGSASIDTVGFISLDSALKSKDDFWSLALEISKKIREIVTSGEPLRYMYEDVPNFNFQAVLAGGKREAIALTHTGNIDDFLGSEEMFSLIDYKISMRTSRDVGPIFNVETYFLQEKLCISLGYNSALISDTAAQIMVNTANNIFKRIV